MFNINNFQESYHDHRCLIVPEKDVLLIDIPGSGFIVFLRRWWSDLFLLSCNDRRSRVYFTSSRNMSMERFKQYRQYRNRIHPLSKFRNFWDFLTSIVIVLEKFVFHHNTSFIFERVFHIMFSYYLALVLEVIFIADLVVNFETGYIDKQNKKVVLDTRNGILKYCSTKLFFHCISAIPLQCLMFLRLGNEVDVSINKANYFVCVLRIINTFSLYRVFEATKCWTQHYERSSTIYLFRFIRILVVGFISMILLYDLADTLCLVATMWTGIVDRKSFFIFLMTLNHIVRRAPENINIILFSHNMGRICKSFFLFGIRFSRYYLDMMTSLLAYILANIFYMWCLLECYGYLVRRKYHQDHLMVSKQLMLNMVLNRHLPDTIYHKIDHFYDLNMTAMRKVEISNELYKCLPVVLKREATFHCYSNRITRLPFFSGWPIDILEKIVLLLKQDVYMSGDIMAEPWVCGDGLVIVDEGEVAVYTATKQETGHLIDGDYFGELSLVTDQEVRTSRIIATTCCKVLILKKTPFRILMRDHVRLFYSLRRELMEQYEVNEDDQQFA